MAGDLPPFGLWPAPFHIAPTPSPRVLPVNVPFSIFGVTVVVVDKDGNVTIRVDQLNPFAK